MTTKAIITFRGTSQSDAMAVSAKAVADRLGVQVEQDLPYGTLVRGDERQLAELEGAGYRVKLLTDTNILRVGSYRIDTETTPPRVPTKLGVPKSLQKMWSHYLVQLVAPPNQDWIRVIQEHGIDVVEPISACGLFVVGSAEQVRKLEELPFVEWVGPFKPAYRMAPNLKGLRGIIQYVNVGVYPATAVDDVREAIEKSGASIVSQEERASTYSDSYGILLVEIDSSHLPTIANLPATRWLEYEGPVEFDDERSCQIAAGNLDQTPPPGTAPMPGFRSAVAGDLGLTGAGVTIGIADGGVDTLDNATMHPDLAGRMADFVYGGDGTVIGDSHGTHVAGIALGNPDPRSGARDHDGFLLGQGVAPGSMFVSLTGKRVVPDSQVVETLTENNGRVMNSSLGRTNSAGAGYTNESIFYDLRVRDAHTGLVGLQQLAVVASAGNEGPGANTIKAPWAAKNVIVVGNSLNFRPREGNSLDDIRGLNRKSSRGPSRDGRYLPTIVAPGTDIVSARMGQNRQPYRDRQGNVHDRYTMMSGTSMAAPHVSGLCALLIEWWRKNTNGRNPSPAMVKALLINGAIDIAGGDTGRVDDAGNPELIANIPNNDQGWGRVSLRNMVLQAPSSDRGPKIFFDQRHAFTSEGQEYVIRVAPFDPMRPMRITVVWTDAPGESLINDLDLEVTEESTGNIYRGNWFENGFSTTGGNFDQINNTECVYVQKPAGIYEVRIIAAHLRASALPDVTTSWQDFALVIDNAAVPAAASVSVVPVIDRSGSMVSYGYAGTTRISSKQFVDLMSIDDLVGVVSFGSTSTLEFPTGAAPTLQTITDQSIKDAAKRRIDTIAFGGCTFIGAGIAQAGDLLRDAPGARSMVLLSDGYDNRGCQSSNPARPSALEAVDRLPRRMPVYTCAMGPTSDQGLLERIAETTNGRYFYMPSINDLFEIYNYIRGQVTGNAIIVNESAMASSSRVAAFVDAPATEVTFTVAWADPKLRYVVNDPQQTNEISVRLRDPRNRLLHPSDSYVQRIVGEGYVAFKLHEPGPGQWHVEVSTARKAHTRYTVGGFVASPLRMTVAVRPTRVIAGAPLKIAAQVFDGKQPIAGFRARAEVTHRSRHALDLLEKYKIRLLDIDPIKVSGGDVLPEEVAKLLALRAELLEAQLPDLFDHEVSRVMLHNTSVGDSNRQRLVDLLSRGAIQDALQGAVLSGAAGLLTQAWPAQIGSSSENAGDVVGQFNDTLQPGSYNVAVTATGASPISNTRFVRKDMVSVLVQ